MILRVAKGGVSTVEVFEDEPVDESGGGVVPGTGAVVRVEPVRTEGDAAIDIEATRTEARRVLDSEEAGDRERVMERRTR